MTNRNIKTFDVAAYLLDRADQYETESPCWIALADAAANIANGDALASLRAGELDDAPLRRRVASMATRGIKPVIPSAGVEP